MSSPYRVIVDVHGAKRARAWEWALRFAFGGAVTAGAGLAAKVWGPEIGGLFLAFPSILPASLTLVARHDGRDQAREDARGAAVGSFGLVVFAVIASATARAWSASLVLVAATAAWLVLSVALWAALVARRGENDRAASEGSRSDPQDDVAGGRKSDDDSREDALTDARPPDCSASSSDARALRARGRSPTTPPR